MNLTAESNFMLSTEIQEAVVTNAFFDELSKTAGPIWEGLKATGQSMLTHFHGGVAKARNVIADKAIAKSTAADAKYVGDVEKLVTDIQGRPRHLTSEKVKELKDSNKNLKTLAGAATALGLGGLGFGYYQLKKNENDQLARTYPQVG
jgi:hypothetical protein